MTEENWAVLALIDIHAALPEPRFIRARAHLTYAIYEIRAAEQGIKKAMPLPSKGKIGGHGEGGTTLR